MLRSLLSALAAGLLLLPGAVRAEEKKDTVVNGVFESYKDGTLTLKVPAKPEARTVTYKVADDFKTTILNGKETKELVAKESFKDLKAGTPVSVILGEGDKVTGVRIVLGGKNPEKPGEKKNPVVSGAFESYKDGTLTLKVPGKPEARTVSYKIADDFKTVVFTGAEKKELAAKEGFKDLMAGTQVSVTLGEGDKVTAVQIGNPPKKPGEKKDTSVNGTFESYRDGTLTLKVKTKTEDKTVAFKVADDFKTSVFTGAEKKELAAKESFKDLKPGTPVFVTLGEGDKVTAVQIGVGPKKPEKPNEKKDQNVSGKFESYRDGVLILAFPVAKAPDTTVDYKIAPDFKTTVVNGEEVKELAAREGFKDLKVGTPVTVTLGEGNKVLAVQIGGKKK
jgi:hypothetical protein